MKRRAGSPELLDGVLEPATLAENLRDLARVNRWLGGRAISAKAIRPLSLRVPALTILDVGTGAADIPLYLGTFTGFADHGQGDGHGHSP